MDKEKLQLALDLLRLALIQQRELTDRISGLYTQINEITGSMVSASPNQKTKSKAAFGPDPNYVQPRVTPESQTLRDHIMTREF
jgi:hypothetical protein